MTMISDRHLQEDPAVVLERPMIFAPDGEWDTKDCRMGRVVAFMEQRHYLALARMHDALALWDRIAQVSRLYARLANMVRGWTLRPRY